MKSILVISNTYYQLITAIRLRTTLWADNKVDIILSDHSNNAESVSKRLTEEHIFNNVMWTKTKEIDQSTHNLSLQARKFLFVLTGSLAADCFTNLFYDELVYYNTDVFVHGLFAKLNKINPELLCSRYEEGILSYQDSSYFKGARLNLAIRIRTLFHEEILEKKTQRFYCFYPNIYEGKLQTIAIPQFEDFKNIGECLSRIFELKPEMSKIREKYIFFTSVYDFEGGDPIGEIDIVSKIAKLVGKDNLLIKTHPRDSRTVYAERGFHVYENSSIPWEAIQFHNDFSDKCFVTVNSGSVLGVNMIVKKKVRTYFFYDCCNLGGNTDALATKNSIEHVISNPHCNLDKICIIKNFEEFARKVEQAAT